MNLWLLVAVVWLGLDGAGLFVGRRIAQFRETQADGPSAVPPPYPESPEGQTRIWAA